MIEAPFKGTKVDIIPGNQCFVTESGSLVDKYLSDHRNGHAIFNLENLGLTIVHTGQVSDQPDPHIGSEVNYWVTTYSGRDKILCGHIPPFRKTSRHTHPSKLSERYKILGEMFVWREDLGITRLVGTPEAPALLNIPPGIEHFGFTLARPALTVIRMRNAALYPEDQQHIRR